MRLARSITLWLSALLLLTTISSPVSAQVSSGDRQRVLAAIDSAKQGIDPNRFPKIEESNQDVLESIEKIRAMMNRGTSSENRNAWLEYLDLEPLEMAIQEEQPLSKLASAAIETRHRLIGTLPGLELTRLRELRSNIENLISAIRFRDGNKSAEQLEKQLDSLAERIEKLETIPSAEDAAALSSISGLLEASNQATDIVRELQRVFGRPNFCVLIGESIVQRSVYRQVNQSRAVSDCILGTRIVGTACTTGVVTANLLPSVRAARIKVNMMGNVSTNNIGYNGPVKLRTSGYGNISASRVLNVNEAGVSFEPTVAHAALNTQINRIDHKLRLVRKIARKRAAEQKPKADRIALGKMQQQVSDEFDRQTSEGSSIKIPDISSRIGPMLKRLALREPTRLWGSTNQAIYVDALLRRSDQLASAVSRPLVPTSFEVAIQVQESLVDNAIAPMLAGRTINQSELSELLERSGRSLPKSNSQSDTPEKDEPPFEIDFARLQPVVFAARDGNVRIGIRGTRFAQGKRVLKMPMEITALYQPARTLDGKALLIRSGEVDVSFPGRKRLSISQSAIKGTIQKRFNDMFPETLLDRPIEVPATVEMEAIRGRQYRVTHIEARDGWLTIAAQ